MKKILYVFLIFVVLMAFSCASNPASVPDVSGAAEDFAEGTEEDVTGIVKDFPNAKVIFTNIGK